MSKFNESRINSNKTTNKSGHVAYSMADKDKLMTQVMTSFFNEAKFYGDNSRELVETVKSVINTDAKFVANLALFVRKELHLRTITQVLICELAHEPKGKKYVREVIKHAGLRADDMTEILAYYINTYRKPIPNSLKKGLADIFFTFDEYQLAKYNRTGKAVKLADVLKLVHPVPVNKEQSSLFDKVYNDTLATPYTWETELSTKGNTKAVWEELIDSNRLGYMATLRNLRNILNARVSNLDKVYSYLSNENAVKKSKQLPFRFSSAYNELKNAGLGTSKLYDVLERAIKISCQNIETIKGMSLVSADTSGSMTTNRISSKSDVRPSDIAVLLMCMANYICEDAITTTFNTSIRKEVLSTSNGIIANANSVRVNGGGTDITLPICYAIQHNIFVDRFIILSDNELNANNGGYFHSSRGFEKTCMPYLEEYRRKVNPNVWVHAIDMMGYGTQQFIGKNINLIAGWNEKTLEFISLAEQGTDTMKKRIEKYHF